jgi:large subunit ribosomal protein L22
MKATLRNVRIAPKKANLVAELVRGQNAAEALRTLKFTPKKGAKILYKLINSAVANAENNFGQNKNSLVIKEIKVSKGLRLKRYIPVSRGRAHPLQKDCSHIHVYLETEQAEAKAAKPAKKAESKETKKVEAKKTTKKPAAKKAPAKKKTTKTNKN